MYQEGYIICSDSKKEEILNQMRSFKDYKFLSFSNLKRALTFTVKKNAVYKLTKKFNINPYIASDYIQSLYSLNGIDKDYDNQKYKFLKEIYDYLLSENDIYIDDIFIKDRNNHHFTFINPEDNKEFRYVLTMLDDYEIIEEDNKNKNNNKLAYYDFKTANEEVFFVLSKIKKSLEDNIPFELIKICNINPTYAFLLNMYAHEFKIMLAPNTGTNILSTNEAQLFLDLLKTKNTFDEVIYELSRLDNKEIINKIIDSINDYQLYNERPCDTIDLFRMVFEDLTYSEIKYDKQIEIIDPSDLSSYKDYYIYFMNFSNEVPKIYKDEDYLSDKDKLILGIDTSADKNRLSIDNISRDLKNINNLTITYSKFKSFDTSVESSLIGLLNIEKLGNNAYEFANNKVLDDLYLSMSVDNLSLYGIKDELLDDNYYKELDYKTFDNKFTGLNNEYKPKLIKLSYSALSSFFACPFAYYVNNIINLGEFEHTLSTTIGTYAHGILQDYEQNASFDLEKSSEYWLAKVKEDIDITDKELFYFNRMKENLKLVISQIAEHKSHNVFNKSLCENRQELLLKNDKLLFKGFVDKIWYNDDLKAVAIIDYKTGSDVASLDYIEEGMNLQLPVYIYFLRNNNKFKDYDLVGFYLQKIGVEIPNKSFDATFEQQRKAKLKLTGFTNEQLYNLIDDTKGDYLANFKVKTDKKTGKETLSGALFNKELEAYLVELVDKKLDEAYNQIISNSFEIRETILGDASKCGYCNYKDICYKTEKDKKYIKKPSKKEDK